MLAVTHSGALLGVTAEPITVEVNSGERGELKYILVGLPDSAVKESQDRVISALENCGFKAPHTKTTINLAPGYLRKEGPAYDLPIALCILSATQQIPNNIRLKGLLIAGELSLSGSLRAIRGGLALAILAKKMGLEGLLLPRATAEEASLIKGINVYPIDSLSQAAGFLNDSFPIEPIENSQISLRLSEEKNAFSQLNPKSQQDKSSEVFHSDPPLLDLDFADVRGQQSLRRAVEIAVSGNHNLLIIGSPGSGKSMVAKRIPGIMPQPTLDEYLEILTIHSAARPNYGSIKERQKKGIPSRPFRSPHHTISEVALIGGGSIPKPGEISLAHNGVLFLDELPEFKRSTLEAMRQPIEDGIVSISRIQAEITLPASFMLIAAMNPCPCGYNGDLRRNCRCSLKQIERYRSRISGPLLDRIDLHVTSTELTVDQFHNSKNAECSVDIRRRCESARAKQIKRYKHKKNAYDRCNGRMSPQEVKKYCQLAPNLQSLINYAMQELKLSLRAYDRILKVARTIADLANCEIISERHLLEAIQYRNLDQSLAL